MASSGLRQRGPGDPILERLDDLRRDSVRAERVYQYVASGQDAPVKTLDFLHVLRADEDLALELKGSMGRVVIAAAEDDSGAARYAVWVHDAVAVKRGDGSPVQSRTWKRRHHVESMLEDREPRIRFREDTPLADLDVPDEFPSLAARSNRGP